MNIFADRRISRIIRLKKATLSAEEKLEIVRGAAEDKKAMDIEVIDLRGRTLIADYFLLCTGGSRVHIHGIVDGVAAAMRDRGMRCARREGYTQARWVLLDYGDVVVHIFAQDEREFYDLESLWRGTMSRLTGKEAPQV